MTQSDQEEAPPPFTERLNRTLCFFWVLLNAYWCIYTYLLYRGEVIWDYILSHYYLETLFGYIVFYSLITALIYVFSGKLISPFSKSVFKKTLIGFVLGILSFFMPYFPKIIFLSR
jgi:hypothetical protein